MDLKQLIRDSGAIFRCGTKTTSAPELIEKIANAKSIIIYVYRGGENVRILVDDMDTEPYRDISPALERCSGAMYRLYESKYTIDTDFLISTQDIDERYPELSEYIRRQIFNELYGECHEVEDFFYVEKFVQLVVPQLPNLKWFGLFESYDSEYIDSIRISDKVERVFLANLPVSNDISDWWVKNPNLTVYVGAQKHIGCLENKYWAQVKKDTYKYEDMDPSDHEYSRFPQMKLNTLKEIDNQ